jgi:hypothetical protein
MPRDGTLFRRSAWAAAALTCLVLIGPACGARAADDAGDAPPEEASNEAAAGAPADVRDQAGPAAPIDARTLPECELGSGRSSGGCRFVFDNLCYDTARAACACACPRGGETSCIIGGFLSSDEPQRVTCIPR